MVIRFRDENQDSELEKLMRKRHRQRLTGHGFSEILVR
jgi:hypothetical protein